MTALGERAEVTVTVVEVDDLGELSIIEADQVDVAVLIDVADAQDRQVIGREPEVGRLLDEVHAPVVDQDTHAAVVVAAAATSSRPS